jgi:hypothetical protein
MNKFRVPVNCQVVNRMSTDTLPCLQCLQERDSSSLSDEKCVDSAAAANGSEASTSINGSTADAGDADKTVAVRVAADSMQSSAGPHPGSEDVSDSKRDKLLKNSRALSDI